MIEHLKTLLREQSFGSGETAVGERVFTDFIPAGNVRPIIVLRKQSTDHMNTLEGIGEQEMADVEIFVVATNKADADSIADEVEEFLDDADDAEMGDIQLDYAMLTGRDDEAIAPEDGSDARDIFTRLVATLQYTTD